jgi:hypothetical protein
MTEVLSEAMNTYGAAIQELLSFGFRVYADSEAETGTTWVADSSEVKIHGSSPLVVLGLAAVWRSRGSGWKIGGRDLYDRAMEGELLRPDVQTP